MRGSPQIVTVLGRHQIRASSETLAYWRRKAIRLGKL